MCIYIPTKCGSCHLSYELLGMLVELVGKASALIVGRPGFESPHGHFHQETELIFFLIYVLKKHVLAFQRVPGAAGAIDGSVEPTGISWYDIIDDITCNIISYVYMISYMISWNDIMLHIIVYGIWYRVGWVWYHTHKSYDIQCSLQAYDIIDFFMISYAISSY